MTDIRNLWTPGGVSDTVWYGYLAGKLGADSELRRPFLVCLRGAEPGATETHELFAAGGYRDTGILLHRAGQDVFPMSSVPYQTVSKAAPDVDGDGKGDVACIKTGRYVLTDKGIQPYPIFTLTNPNGTTSIACQRDLKHDGKIDGEGPATYSAEAILLHTGLDGLKLNPPSEHTYSIGCQTASLRWLNLIRERAKAAGSKTIDYVLVRAEDAAALMADCPYRPSGNVA